MSDVIRDALIRVRYEVDKSRLQSADTSQTVKALGEVARAHREVATAASAGAKEIDLNAIGARKASESWAEYSARVQEAVRVQAGMSTETARANTSITESAARHEDFGRRTNESWVTAGRGALQFSRGLALLATSSGETSQKMLENLIKIEAVSQLTMGTANLAKFAAGFGPVGIGVAAVAATAAIGATVWDVYTASEEKAIKAAAKHREEAKKLEEQLAQNWERQYSREAQALSGRTAGVELEAGFAPKTREGQAASSARQMEAARREAANLETEHRKRNRRFSAGQFGGSADDAWRAMMEFGTSSELQNELGYQEQRQSIVRREAELGQKSFQEERENKITQARKLEAEQIANLHTQDAIMSPMEKGKRPFELFQYERKREQVERQIESIGMMAPLGASTAMRGFSFEKNREEPFRAQAQQDVDKAREITTAQTAFADAMIAAFNDAQRKITQLRQELGAAHPN